MKDYILTLALGWFCHQLWHSALVATRQQRQDCLAYRCVSFIDAFTFNHWSQFRMVHGLAIFITDISKQWIEQLTPRYRQPFTDAETLQKSSFFYFFISCSFSRSNTQSVELVLQVVKQKSPISRRRCTLNRNMIRTARTALLALHRSLCSRAPMRSFTGKLAYSITHGKEDLVYEMDSWIP